MLEPAPHDASIRFGGWSVSAGPAASECAWCGAPLGAGDARLFGRIRCSRCGVETTSPWPSDDDLDAAYGEWYRPGEGRFGGIGDALLRRTRSTFAGRIDRLAPPGPVLDVGAGDGTLVAALRARGREAIGLERAATGEHIRDQDIDEVTGSWAAIVFWHSLEHLREPRAALEQAVRLLEPGGVLVLALPNSDSLQAKLFPRHWFALDLPRHLVHVPARAVRGALEDLGLTIVGASNLRGGQVAFGWAHGLVGSLPGSPDLYDAIRTPQARSRPMSGARRAATLAAAVIAAPFAIAGAVVEVLRGRGGTTYLEARR